MKRTGAGIAVLRGAEVLLVRRGDNGLWDIPGGGTQGNETPEDAARRELGEETGLSVGPLRSLGMFPHQHTYPDGNAVDWETHVLTAEFAGGVPEAANDASAARWWPLSALPPEVSAATQAYFVALQQFLEPAPR